MSDTATVSTETATYRRPSGLNAIYQDSRVIAWRNLVHLPRTPQLVIFTLIQPIMFVLLFTYVFGGAIGKALPPGVSYAQFLIPGIMVQTLVFGTSATAVGLAEDLQNGIIDRFRSLPISRSAVLNGRILADMIRLTAVVANLLRALSVGEVLPGSTWVSMSLPVFLWIVGITAVAAPLAVNRYRQA